ncbi:MAG: hypothetical protein AAF975_00470 [Spirochaetota bacterium]
MKDAKAFLDLLLEQQPIIAEQLQGVDVFALWPKVLHGLGLDVLAENSSVIDWDQRHLYLAVRHSVFLQELKLYQNLWLPAMEAALMEAGFPYSRIGKVHFRVQSLWD